jgi:6-pyruvoyltetrahydropterin/6-carboxytetrahydropterin synthase
VQEILAPFDHHVINEVPPFDRRNTTAELLSAYFFAEVEAGLARFAADTAAERGVRVIRIEVWENDSSCAVYEPLSGLQVTARPAPTP